jgi:hypothetical protein
MKAAELIVHNGSRTRWPLRIWTIAEFATLWSKELPPQQQLRQRILDIVWAAVCSSSFAAIIPTDLYGTNDPELYLWYTRGGVLESWERVSRGTHWRQAGPGHKRGTKLKEVKRFGINRSELYFEDDDGALTPVHPAKVGYLLERVGRRRLRRLKLSAFGIWRWLRSEAGISQVIGTQLSLPLFVQKHWPRSARSEVRKRYSAVLKVARPRTRGRPRGEKYDDSKLLKKMSDLLCAKKAPTISAAARLVSHDRPGHSVAATVRRLQRKFARSPRKPLN